MSNTIDFILEALQYYNIPCAEIRIIGNKKNPITESLNAQFGRLAMLTEASGLKGIKKISKPQPRQKAEIPTQTPSAEELEAQRIEDIKKNGGYYDLTNDGEWKKDKRFMSDTLRLKNAPNTSKDVFAKNISADLTQIAQELGISNHKTKHPEKSGTSLYDSEGEGENALYRYIFVKGADGNAEYGLLRLADHKIRPDVWMNASHQDPQKPRFCLSIVVGDNDIFANSSKPIGEDWHLYEYTIGTDQYGHITPQNRENIVNFIKRFRDPQPLTDDSEDDYIEYADEKGQKQRKNVFDPRIHYINYTDNNGKTSKVFAGKLRDRENGEEEFNTNKSRYRYYSKYTPSREEFEYINGIKKRKGSSLNVNNGDDEQVYNGKPFLHKDSLIKNESKSAKKPSLNESRWQRMLNEVGIGNIKGDDDFIHYNGNELGEETMIESISKSIMENNEPSPYKVSYRGKYNPETKYNQTITLPISERQLYNLNDILAQKGFEEQLQEGLNYCSDEVRDLIFSIMNVGSNPRAKADRRTIINVKIVG